MPIALLTDFGSRDWFAGELKGALLRFSPQARIVDLTHSVEPGDIRGGALALLSSFRSFPPGTLFLCSVSYGNISQKAVAVTAGGYFFLSPDNGLLSWALGKVGDVWLREIDKEKFLLNSGCATFPARDLLSPLGAKIHDGLEFSESGPLLDSYARLPWPETEFSENRAAGEIIYIDGFGNAVTSVSPRELAGKKFSQARLKGNRMIPLGSHYGEVMTGMPLVYPGSGGLMEIGVNGGSAAGKLGLEVGEGVEFEFKD
ncbi:MAG: S-adenosyl-l-methionine hydroxide adenosyltransferase family protein [Chitinispirillaceae bacterium]